MITPSFSLTATERVLPSLLLDFTRGVLDSRVTFTRASTATYFNSVGAITSAAINEARFDYNPTTLAALGLLIEESRTNLVLNSATLITQNVTVTAVAHTLSFYGTGTVVISGTGTGTLVGSGAFPTRSTLTFTPTVGVVTLTVTGTVTQAQLEIGAFASSYIPTTAATATREADVAVMTGTNFSSWYNATEGTLCINATPYSPVSNPTNQITVSIDNGTITDRIQLARTSLIAESQSFISAASVTLYGVGVSGTWNVNIIGKQALAYKTSNNGTAFNGVFVSGASIAGVPVVNRMTIGSRADGTVIWNGAISSIAYYNLRLTNAEVQAFSKG